ELESSIKDLFSTTEWDVHLSVIGGDLELDPNRLDLMTLFKKAMEFKKEVLKNPVKTYVDVIPYEEMPEFMGLDSKVLKYDIDLITNAMKAINLICDYSQLSNDIEEANRDIGSRVYLKFKEFENDMEYNIESRVYLEFKKLETDVEHEKKKLIKFIQGAKFDPNIKFPENLDVRMMRSRLKELTEAGVPNYITIIHGSNWHKFCDKLPSKLDINRDASLNHIGIGMSKETVGADKMPGKCVHSFGYYGCGSLYHRGWKIGSLVRFKAGDTIGFGYNFSSSKYFITRNGEKLKITLSLGPFTIKPSSFPKFQCSLDMNSYYPSIGLGPEDEISVNFGNKEFKYNINDYIAKVCIIYLQY
ncbi:6409_t:CDS:2, partial [Cetraspora pellucida]